MPPQFRLCAGLAPTNFQEYVLERGLVRDRETLAALPGQGDSEAHASARNWLFLAPVAGGADAAGPLLLLGAGGLHEAPRLAGGGSALGLRELFAEAAEAGGGSRSADSLVAFDGDALARCGRRLLLLERGREVVDLGAVPEPDPGYLVAAARSEASEALHVLFARRVQLPEDPCEHFCLSLGSLPLPAAPGTARAFTPLGELLGTAPPLAAVWAGGRCLVVANGPFRGVDAATGRGPAPAEGQEDGEVDEDLRCLLEARGCSAPLPKLGSRPVAVVTELQVGAPLVVGSLLLGHFAIAAGPGQADAAGCPAVRVVLRTPDGHGAIAVVSPQLESGTAGPLVARHVSTFPGLGCACDTLGFAYLLLSPSGRLAVVARWRGSVAVELLVHPGGEASAPTQGLRLPQGARLWGVHVEEDAVFLWHSQGLERCRLEAAARVPTAAASAAPALEEAGWDAAPAPEEGWGWDASCGWGSPAPGDVDADWDDWGSPPQAPDAGEAELPPAW